MTSAAPAEDSAAHEAVGGYFGVEPLGPRRPWPWAAGLRLQSARAALGVWLQARRPTALWLPWFVCTSLLEPLQRHGVSLHRYALDEQLRPRQPPRLGPGEALLYVDYFGLCESVELELAAMYPAHALVFDHAQALYAPPRGTATLYSPRKFVGVADGGILACAESMTAPATVDTGSEARLQGARLRLAQGAEAGFAAFQMAERSLDDQAPLAMSALTEDMLASIDAEEVARRRRRNFEFVHAALAPFNRLQPLLGPTQVPLCYPFWPRRPMARADFHRARVYLPTYWPELIEDARVPAPERSWAAQWLHLPIDQRYDTATLQQRVVAPILRHHLDG